LRRRFKRLIDRLTKIFSPDALRRFTGKRMKTAKRSTDDPTNHPATQSLLCNGRRSIRHTAIRITQQLGHSFGCPSGNTLRRCRMSDSSQNPFSEK
jgi:hypothetical protein